MFTELSSEFGIVVLQYAMLIGRTFLFNDPLSTTVIRHRTYGMDYSDCNRENPLPPLHELFFPINSKGSFICIIP